MKRPHLVENKNFTPLNETTKDRHIICVRDVTYSGLIISGWLQEGLIEVETLLRAKRVSYLEKS